MNYFRTQEVARRNTLWLVILFALAVSAVILTTNLLFIAAIYFATYDATQTNHAVDIYTGEHWLVVSVTTLGVILICSFFRQLSLRHGSDVANALGATLLDPGTRDKDERRLLNVVEEISIASGMPVPDVYVMEDSGINAFAAGFQPSDAIIGVTRGTLTSLNREQLQGVIAHEFSHIFNGDMRMNMRLTGVIYGIVFLGQIGRMILRGSLHSVHVSSSRSPWYSSDASSSRGNSGGGTAIALGLGIGLLIIGYAGEFFGRIIKSAVSRQREFLADASAVQFTRNPSGVSDALKVIGHGAGSRVGAPAALEMSHFFFGPVMRFKRSMFATHPPLDERIQRIEPGWNGHYLAPRQPAIEILNQTDTNKAGNYSSSTSHAIENSIMGFNSADSGLPIEPGVEEITSTESPTIEYTIGLAPGARGHDLLISETAIFNAMSAQALVFALLMTEATEEISRRQQDLVQKHLGQAVFRETLRYLREARVTKRRDHLELIERSLPALRRLSLKQYRTFNQTLVAMVQLDGKIDLHEWCLYRLVLQYLGGHFGTLGVVTQKHKSAHAVADEIAIIMAYIAESGHNQTNAIDLAYHAGMLAGNFLMRPRNAEHTVSKTLKPLNKSLAVLARSAPHVREQLIKAMIVCVRHDHHITDEERDMIRTIAAIMETPLGMFGDEAADVLL